MKTKFHLFLLYGWLMGIASLSSVLVLNAAIETDEFKTQAGALQIAFVGHGSLYFTFNNKVIHIDPVGRYADYSQLPKADIILITHEHGDHLDPKAIAAIRKKDTQLIYPKSCATQVSGGKILSNGENTTVTGIKIEAVPAYNLEHKRNDGVPYHAKGSGNGYVLTFGELRAYVAGDTENTPEMKALKNIDIAFLPMNLPYTMTPEMVADAAKGFKPKILYPYHYGDTDPLQLKDLLKENKEIEIRIRNLK
jgi:L-ascorbate metabolism protein UlaG (beta-lactamase superfamily)